MPALIRVVANDTSGVANWTRSWSRFGVGLAEVTYRDADIPRVLHQVVPQHAATILSMRAPIERADMVRYALMYRDGGVYADLDMELLSPSFLHRVLRTGRAVFPLEKGRLVGQSLLASPARHPVWLAIIDSLVAAYDPRCYEPHNTGPDALTAWWNGECHEPRWRLTVEVSDGFTRGAVSLHHVTHSWARAAGAKEHMRRAARECPHKRRGHLERRCWSNVTWMDGCRSISVKALPGKGTGTREVIRCPPAPRREPKPNRRNSA